MISHDGQNLVSAGILSLDRPYLIFLKKAFGPILRILCWLSEPKISKRNFKKGPIHLVPRNLGRLCKYEKCRLSRPR